MYTEQRFTKTLGFNLYSLQLAHTAQITSRWHDLFSKLAVKETIHLSAAVFSLISRPPLIRKHFKFPMLEAGSWYKVTLTATARRNRACAEWRQVEECPPEMLIEQRDGRPGDGGTWTHILGLYVLGDRSKHWFLNVFFFIKSLGIQIWDIQWCGLEH